MKIATRLKLVALAVVVAAVVFGALFERWRTELESAVDEMQRSRHQLSLGIAIDRNIDHQLMASPTATPEEHVTFASEGRRLIAELRASASGERDAAAALFVEVLASLEQIVERVPATTPGNLELLDHARDIVVDIVGALVAREQYELEQTSAAMAAREWTPMLVPVAVMALLTLAVMLAIVVPLRRYMSNVIATTQRIAWGDLDTPVQLPGPPDIAELGDAIEHMRAGLFANLGVATRLRELEQFDRALKASEERYRTLFAMSPLPSWSFDAETLEIRRANRAMAALTGYTEDQLHAMRIDHLVAGIDDGITRIRSKRGDLVELEVTSHTIIADGRVCTLSVAIDVTEARRVEAQLRQAQKMEAIGQLAGGVAHDFNNILAVISMSAELLESDLGEDHASHDDVREIRTAADRGARLTRQLLAFSRKQQVLPKPVSVNAAVGELEKMLRRVVGEDIEIATSQSVRAGVVEIDPGQFEQIIMNLVVNARDAMPDGGHITLETGAVDLDPRLAAELGLSLGCYSVLTVADTGCGMDAQTKARIFEPFFTTKGVGKGTGLGLANVFGIVSANKGAVAVESEPGCGSIFRIYLPRIADRLTESMNAATPELGIPEAATVLVVEDEDAVRSAICRMVSAWGHQCIQARSGDIAIEILRAARAPIDLLITDIVMPGMSGHALVTEARRMRPELKVLMMSGYSEHPSLKRGPEVSGEAFVAKPFTAHSLSAAVHAVLAGEPVSTATHAA